MIEILEKIKENMDNFFNCTHLNIEVYNKNGYLSFSLGEPIDSDINVILDMIKYNKNIINLNLSETVFITACPLIKNDYNNGFYIIGPYSTDKNNEDKVSENYFVQIMNFPKRKFILKRGIKAKNYFEYVNEVGCEIWGLLCSIKEALNEPIGVWLPEKFITEGTSVYVQGVELPMDYCGIVPEGLEIITLPSCKMMVFQGEPFEDEDYNMAIKNISKAINKYNPSLYGYEWATDKLPSFQMEPQGYRGYIEGHPVREI